MAILHVPTFQVPLAYDTDIAAHTFTNTSAQVMGIANAWTVAFSIKPTGGSNAATFTLGSAGSRVNWTYTSPSSMTLITTNSANGSLKSYTYNLTSIIFPNVWTHVVTTWDGTTLQSYFNGVATAPTTINNDNAGTMADNTRTINIMAAATGDMGHLGMWNVVLGANEAADLYNNGGPMLVDLRSSFGRYVSSNSLCHYWMPGYWGNIGKDFGDPVGAAGTPTIDLNANGTAVAADIIGESFNYNAYGRWQDFSLDLDGSTEGLRSTTARLLGISTAWTVDVWVRSTRDTAQETIFEIRNAATSINRIRMQKRGDLAAGELEIDVYNSAGNAIRDFRYASAIPINEWVHLLFVFDTATPNIVNLYKNGLPFAPTTVVTGPGASTNMTATTRQVGFGYGSQADQFFRGQIYRAAVWASVLSNANIVALANPATARSLNLLKPGFGYTDGSTLVQWFRAGLGSLDGATTGASFVANDVLPASAIIAGGISQGSSNIANADMIQLAPG